MLETTKESAVFRASVVLRPQNPRCVEAQPWPLEPESSHSPPLTCGSRRLLLYDPGVKLIMWDESSHPLLFSDSHLFFFFQSFSNENKWNGQSQTVREECMLK